LFRLIWMKSAMVILRQRSTRRDSAAIALVFLTFYSSSFLYIVGDGSVHIMLPLLFPAPFPKPVQGLRTRCNRKICPS